MSLWVVTFEPTNLLGGDQFAPQNKDSVPGRAALLDNVNTILDTEGATAVHVTPSE